MRLGQNSIRLQIDATLIFDRTQYAFLAFSCFGQVTTFLHRCSTLSMGFMEHIFLVFDSVFLALGLASNLFVCFIMTRRKLVGKNLSNFYIFHLAMAEIVYRMVTAVLRIFTSMIDPRLLSHGDCKAMTFFPHATCATVFILLAGIAMDRENHIMNPLKTLGRTGHRKKRIASIWLFSMAISFPMIFGAHVNPLVTYGTGQDNSSQPISITPAFICVLPRKSFASQISFTIFFFFAFVAPLSIITASYWKIFIFLRKRATKRTMSPCCIRSKYNALRMLVLIVVSLLLSWGPFMLLELAKVYGARVRFEDISVKEIAMSISLTSSVIHPVLYSFGNANFRWEVVRTFRDCKTCFSTKIETLNFRLQHVRN